MKKNTLFMLAFTVMTTFLSFSQATVEVVAYPTEIALVSGTTYGPSVGQNPYVINFTNIPSAVEIWSPTIPVADLNSSFGAGTILANGETPGRNGAGNIGTATGLHNVPPVDAGGNAANAKVINLTSNGDGTYNFTVIATRWVFASIVEGTAYATHFRYFAPVTKYFTSVALESGSATEYEVVGFVYNSGATAESEANLLTTGATLSNKKFSASKLNAIYSSSKQAILMNRNLGEDFSIYNLMGQTVSKGRISKEINVETLKSGLYILSTKQGSLKFVK